MRKYFKIVKRVDMGNINIESGKVQITDPCYDPDLWCSHIEKIKKGEYICKAVIIDGDDWGNRVAELTINHISTPKRRAEKLLCCPGVDSGQCGFFDADYYAKYHKTECINDNKEDEDWYNKVCDLTCHRGVANDDCCGTIDNKGVVSESGFGDGMYDCYAGYNTKGEITALRLRFI